MDEVFNRLSESGSLPFLRILFVWWLPWRELVAAAAGAGCCASVGRSRFDPILGLGLFSTFGVLSLLLGLDG